MKKLVFLLLVIIAVLISYIVYLRFYGMTTTQIIIQREKIQEIEKESSERKSQIQRVCSKLEAPVECRKLSAGEMGATIRGNREDAPEE